MFLIRTFIFIQQQYCWRCHSLLPDLKEIAKKRKELNLTQRELAKLAGVSRSWIAKVESKPEKLMPSYLMAKNVFDVLERKLNAQSVKMKAMKSFTIEDVHNTKIEYAGIDEQIEEVWKRMEDNGYSQLPVRDREKIVGSLTERGVIRKIKETDQKDLKHLRVRDAIEDPFPPPKRKNIDFSNS